MGKMLLFPRCDNKQKRYPRKEFLVQLPIPVACAIDNPPLSPFYPPFDRLKESKNATTNTQSCFRPYPLSICLLHYLKMNNTVYVVF